MSNGITSLGDIIASVAKAAAEAQGDVAESQLSRIFNFFERRPKKDSNGNDTDELTDYNFPINFTIAIPDSNSEDENAKLYSIPYLAMLPLTHVHIENIKTEFDIALVGIDSSHEGQTSNIKEFKDIPSLNIDVTGGGIAKQNGISAHVSLTLCRHDLPEGTSRMINELINRCQGYTKDYSIKQKKENE